MAAKLLKMSGKTKYILIFIFPTFVADDRWFPNAV